jgi:hypothetical protein
LSAAKGQHPSVDGLASLIFDVILSIPAEQRKKEVTVVCTDTRVEIPAIAEMIEGTLDRMRKCSQQNGPNVSDTSTPSCGSSRFGCWTCTVVERDRASEGLLASGDERMEKLIEFRELLQSYRDPDDGRGVARIVNRQKGVIMNADLSELNRLREMEVLNQRRDLLILSIRLPVLRRRRSYRPLAATPPRMAGTDLASRLPMGPPQPMPATMGTMVMDHIVILGSTSFATSSWRPRGVLPRLRSRPSATW